MASDVVWKKVENYVVFLLNYVENYVAFLTAFVEIKT